MLGQLRDSLGDLEKKEAIIKYIDLIKYMYDSSVTSIIIVKEETRESFIIISLHWGLALSLYLFDLVMNALTKYIYDQIL